MVKEMIDSLFPYIKMRYFHVYEVIKYVGFHSFLKETVYLNREAIPVEKDLSCLIGLSKHKSCSTLEVLEINHEILRNGHYHYRFHNRRQKAYYYLRSGFHGFGIVDGREIVGDIWYCDPFGADKSFVHPDLLWLGIECQKKQVYSFDMFLAPQKRGHNYAFYLQNYFLHHLKERNFSKVYGYFWADNIPALWVHRQIKWKELRRVRSHRFFFLKIH
jgi:GNAT superfamily N-acetyltransferase